MSRRSIVATVTAVAAGVLAPSVVRAEASDSAVAVPLCELRAAHDLRVQALARAIDGLSKTTPTPLLRIVAADIDRDGDLDVVATTRGLGLLVWINDGQGRLTPQRPRAPTGLRQDPPEAGFQGFGAGRDDPLQEDSSWLRLAPRQTGISLAPAAGVPPERDVTVSPDYHLSSRSPRAPPVFSHN